MTMNNVWSVRSTMSMIRDIAGYFQKKRLSDRLFDRRNKRLWNDIHVTVKPFGNRCVMSAMGSVLSILFCCLSRNYHS
jgi:hypothetical protein